MSNLPTNYVDDVLNADVNTRRKYQMIQNGDGTVSLVDVTDYDTVGSSIGAVQINAQNTQINQNTEDISSLNQHLTDIDTDLSLDYSKSTLPLDTDINTFLQGILERMYPIAIMRGTWTAGGGASVTRNSDNQLSMNTGSGNSPYMDSPSFSATSSTSTLRIVGTVNSGNTWATMNIKALPSNTSIASWNTNNSGRNINITATVPAGTTSIRLEGFHTGNGTDVYTQFNISE